MHTENSFYLKKKKKKEKKVKNIGTNFFSFPSLIVTKFHNQYPPLLLWFCIVQILMLKNCYEHVVGC